MLKIHTFDIAVLFLGMVLCNFALRAITDQKWSMAADRSIFQAAALASVLIFSAINKSNP